MTCVDGWDLRGKTMVVPGGGETLGKTLCLALAREGAHVVILAGNPSKPSSFMERSHALDGSAEVLKADVLDKEQLLAARETILERFGGIYGLLNFAGGNVPETTTSTERKFFDLPEDVLRSAVEVNLLGTIFSHARSLAAQWPRPAKG